jgi:hypothetical protein
MSDTSDQVPLGKPPVRSASRTARLAELQADIARRLRPLCATMPQAEFDALAGEMAERQLKYELRHGS